MTEIASAAQLRMGYVRWALASVPLLVLLGTASGILSNSGYSNAWFATLTKPALMPPGYVFGIVWTILYVLLGLSVALILSARRSPGRGRALGVFAVQMLLNFAWSPLFFGAHRVAAAFALILVMIVLTLVVIVRFRAIRPVAAWLHVPYLLWICFAAWLTFDVLRLNAGQNARLVGPVIDTQI